MANKTTSLILCMLTVLFLLLSSPGNVLNPRDGGLETREEIKFRGDDQNSVGLLETPGHHR